MDKESCALVYFRQLLYTQKAHLSASYFFLLARENLKKIKLADWAALAEVIGTVGVIVSLIFVAFSINNNTSEFKAAQANQLYESSREVELAVASDNEWARIIVKGQKNEEPLSELEQYRYDVYLVQTMDIWDGLLERYVDGLMSEENLTGWDQYYIDWAERFVSDDAWQRIKWQYAGGITEEAVGARVEQVIANRAVE